MEDRKRSGSLARPPLDDAQALKDSLARLEAESWELYLAELHRLDVSIEEVDADDWVSPLGQLLRSDPGHPLGGHGMPSGAPLGGDDSGSHIMRWMAILRLDPCAYCGRLPGGTVDHIEPQKMPLRDTHTWLNMTAACSGCNAGKRDRSMLEYLRRKSSGRRAPALAA